MSTYGYAAQGAVALPFEGDLTQAGQLYKALPEVTPNSANHSHFANELTLVPQVDLRGGSYWFNVKVSPGNQTSKWVLQPQGSYIEQIKVYAFANGQQQYAESGQFSQGNYLLLYGMPLQLQQGQVYDIWLYFESRYYSAIPIIELKTQAEYDNNVFRDTLLVLGCLGAIAILSLYNLLIFVWTKDKSYLYYSAYLVVTFAGWFGVFGIHNRLFGLIPVSVMMLPFFLNIITNTFFYQKFLNLKHHSPILSKFGNAVSWSALITICVFSFFPLWTRYLAVAVLNFVWLTTGLIAGIYCLKLGFKPARFFVLGFATVYIGGCAIILPYFGLPRFFANGYMVALVAQTLDVMFLALALADRINILRQEKQEALEKALAADQHANKVLKEANDKLLDALKLSKENQRSKDAFILSVSHELRTPLNAIGASLDQLKHATGDELIELQQYIQFGADRLSSQVENILLLAETDQKEVRPHAREFTLEQMLEQIKNSNQSYLYQKPVELITDIAPNMPHQFIGDDHLITSMLAPVVDNACKYTERGKVSIKIDFRRAQELGEKNQLLVFIEDTGPGISDEIQTKIFDPFMQASTGYQRTHEGLGLGLSISQRLAKILNAAIDLESEVGKGSCFSFCIPIECVYEEVKEIPQDTIFTGHALVVEDNSVNAKVLGSLLRNMGLTMDLAVNGKEAVELPNLQRYDVIFMDLQMPVMDGFTATEQLRKKGVVAPIIAVTANTDHEARTRCWDVGMNDFLGKPVRKEMLLHTLDRWVNCIDKQVAS